MMDESNYWLELFLALDKILTISSASCIRLFNLSIGKIPDSEIISNQNKDSSASSMVTLSFAKNSF